MAGLDVTPDQINTARQAGYSDQEIVSHLSAKAPAQFDVAQKAGYTPTEILQHFAPQPSSTLDNLKQGAAEAVGGLGKTAEVVGGGPGVISSGLQRAANAVRPNDFMPSPIYDDKGFHASGILPTLARGAAPTAATVLAGMAGTAVGGPVAGMGAGVTTAMGMNAGDQIQAAADNATGKPNSPITLPSVVRGGLTAAAQAAPQAVPLGRYLAPAAPLAKTSALGALKTLAGTSLDQAGASAASDVAGQVGQSVGTAGGTQVNPTQTINAAAGGAVTGAAFGTTKAARTAVDASTYKGITPDLQDAATQFANLVKQKADGRNLDVGLGFAGAAQRAGNDAMSKATDAVNGNLKTAVADMNSRTPLTGAPADILNAAMAGKKPTPGQYDTLQSAVAGDPQGANVMNLLRMSHVADIVRGTGYTSGDKFKGGISGSMGNILTGHNIEKSAIAGIGGAALEGGAGHLIAYSPIALGAAAGMSALGRLSDNLTGARGPAGRFVKNFADGSAAPTMAVPPQAPPQAAPAPGMRAGLPSLPPNAGGIAPTPWGAPPPATAASLMTPAQKQQVIMKAMPLVRQLAAQQKPVTLPPNFAGTLPSAQPARTAIPPMAGGSIIPPAVQAQIALHAKLAAMAQNSSAAPTAPAPAPPVMRGALPADVIANARALTAGLRTTAKVQATGASQNAATSEVNASPLISQLVGGAQNVPSPEAGALMSKSLSAARTLARLRSDPEAEAEEVAATKASAISAKAAAKAPTAAPAVTSIKKTNGKTAETQAPPVPTAEAPIEEAPHTADLRFTKVNGADNAIATKAASEFKAASNVPNVVAARYQSSTALRQARERDRLIEASGDHAFPEDDLSFGDQLSQINKMPTRASLSQHIDSLAASYPQHAGVLRKYFGPKWAQSLWKK